MSKYLTVIYRLADNAIPKLVFEEAEKIHGATVSAAAWSHLMDEANRLRDALKTAKEAMDERRGYVNGGDPAGCWQEMKYGEAWDAEDAQVDAALKS